MTTPQYKREEIGFTGPSFPWRLTPSGTVATSSVNVQEGNIALIAEAVTQILRTRKGERFFRRGWGGQPVTAVFRLSSEEEMMLMASEIQDLLAEYEPRVRLIEFVVTDIEADQGYVSIRLGFEHMATQLVEYVEVILS